MNRRSFVKNAALLCTAARISTGSVFASGAPIAEKPATAEDIILHKLYWDKLTPSERQRGDAAGVFAVQRDQLDQDYLRRWASELGVNPTFNLLLEGKLKLGDVVDIEGHFEFVFTPSPFSIEIRAQAKMSLFGMGSFDIDGSFRLDGTGFAAYINLDISGDFGGPIGLQFNVGATLELYIGTLDEKVLTKAAGKGPA